MAFDVTGRRFASVAALLLVAGGLSACTTTEGTNAFTDFATFEREVMTSTAQPTRTGAEEYSVILSR